MTDIPNLRRTCMDKAEHVDLERIALFGAYLNEHPEHTIAAAADHAGITDREATGIINWQWSKS